MKKLIIDMDDVICEKGFIRMINEFMNSNSDQEDAESYYVNDLIPKDRLEEWVEFFKSRNVYDYVNMVKDAKEVIQRLDEKYDVYIATAFVFRDAPQISGKTLNDKYNFLCKALPFIDPHKFIFTSRKDLIDADIRIDDSAKKMTGKAELKLLFTAYHNKKMTKEELDKLGLTRVDSWKEIEEILL